MHYDDANIRIVKQKCTGETDRYALLVNQYMLFCDGDVNVVYNEWLKIKTAADRGDKYTTWTWS